MKPARILTDAEVTATFGDPRQFIRLDGTVSVAWPKKILTTIELPAPLALAGYPGKFVRHVSCHQKIASHLSAAMLEIHQAPDSVWATLNDWGGCYEWRLQRASRKPSRHSWGIAVDMDVADNPMGDQVGGGDVDIDPRVVEIMESHGFYWGGRFHNRDRVDQMHFEFADLAGLA